MNKSIALRSLAFLSAILVLNACGLSVVDEEEKDTEAPPAPASASAYWVEPLAEPNHYDIHFRDDINAQLVSVSGERAQTLPAFFEGGQTYRFLLRNSGSSSPIDVAVPKDLVVTSAYASADQTEMSYRTDGRIFLTRETLLTNFDQPLVLEADEIISDGARLQNFYPESHAELGKRGRTGGAISIKARKATGRLLVALRGEDGGEGQPGKPFAGGGNRGLSYNQRGFRSINCDYFREGGPGVDGRKGRRGHPGEQGGSAGDLLMDVAQAETLDLQIEIAPGNGGVGGRGGAGQEGGSGGYSTVDPNATIESGTGPGPWSEGPDPEDTLGVKFQKLMELGKTNSLTGSIDHTNLPTAFPCGNERGPEGRTGAPGEQGPPGNKGDAGRVCWVREGQLSCN